MKVNYIKSMTPATVLLDMYQQQVNGCKQCGCDNFPETL